jgi:catechol 2,3-dioxygenase-like lactoylglutathione lyase family enzyme
VQRRSLRVERRSLGGVARHSRIHLARGRFLQDRHLRLSLGWLGMKVQYITSTAIITPDPAQSRALFIDALGLPLEPAQPGDDYLMSEHIDGSKHFGVWPLNQAAEACFGSRTWPAERKVPQFSIEFEVESEAAVAHAAAELQAQGYELLHAARTEPWGQIVARIQTSDGAILGISFAPSLH